MAIVITVFSWKVVKEIGCLEPEVWHPLRQSRTRMKKMQTARLKIIIFSFNILISQVVYCFPQEATYRGGHTYCKADGLFLSTLL